MTPDIDPPAPSPPGPASVSPASQLRSQAASGTAEDFAAVLTALGTAEEETGGGGGGGGGNGGRGPPSPERFAVAGRSRPVMTADLVSMLVREAPLPLHVVGMQLDDSDGGAGAGARGKNVVELQQHRFRPLAPPGGGGASGAAPGATEARPAQISISLPAEDRSRLDLAGSSSHFAPLPRLNEGGACAVAAAAVGCCTQAPAAASAVPPPQHPTGLAAARSAAEEEPAAASPGRAWPHGLSSLFETTLSGALGASFEGRRSRLWEDEADSEPSADELEAVRAAERARRDNEAERRRRAVTRARTRENGAVTIQAAQRGRLERHAVAARRPPPEQWRFAKSCVRHLDSAGHNQAAFFVSGHERLEVIEARGTGRLLLTATDVHGAVVVDGGIVYDSAAPLLVSSSGSGLASPAAWPILCGPAPLGGCTGRSCMHAAPPHGCKGCGHSKPRPTRQPRGLAAPREPALGLGPRAC